jgi:hypothetical protein
MILLSGGHLDLEGLGRRGTNRTTIVPESQLEADRERQTAEARADVLCRAEAQGVKPFTSMEDFAGDAEMTADFDVDEFLRQVQHQRSILPF